MKIQTLNNKHKTKLLEMCEKFIPEYKWTFNNDVEEIGIIDYDFCEVKEGNEQNYYPHGLIHWYQLCLTELSKRIWNQLKDYPSAYYSTHWKNNLTDYLFLRVTSKKLHPVDFLYDFVKECKDKNYFK